MTCHDETLPNASAEVRRLNPQVWPFAQAADLLADLAERAALADKPSTAEKELQRLCEHELTRRGIPYLHLSCRAREKVGWPDLVFPLPNRGRFCAVELKAEHGRVTPAQVETMAAMASCGAIVRVCRTLEQFREVLGDSNNAAVIG